MAVPDRIAAYTSLWVFALAFGWLEASVVVYLREISFSGEAALRSLGDLTQLPATLVSIPNHLVTIEIVREACTILMLAAVAWLAGRRPATRTGAFLVGFGIWDLTYYVVLNLVSGWPGSLRTWDVLFLIPRPWVAPVWAPASVATVFVLAGSRLFWTPERVRRLGWVDAGVLAASVFLIIVAFLVESPAAIDQLEPEYFPAWLFWAGIVAGTAWFVLKERRPQPR